MSLSDELKDPWGLVASGISGGLVWALVTGPVGIGVGVAAGAAVLGVKVATGLLLNKDTAPRREAPELMRPPRGSVAAGWLSRAEQAVQALDDLAATARRGPLSVQVDGAASEARDTLGALARLGAQATAVEGALRRVDDDRLDEEEARLGQAASYGPAEVRTEVARSLAAVRDRIAVRNRLRDARATTLARMQSVTLGLEGLVARLAEVLALAASTGAVDDSVGQVTELAHELEGLRAGLAETEAVSRGALAQAPPPAPS